MIHLEKMAHEIGRRLLIEHEVKNYQIYGSIATKTYDQYSDIDLEIDVSGTDNSLFIQKIPTILAKDYPIIFTDYAPSLAPNEYLISIAMFEEYPFLILDVKCTATPHYQTLSKNDLRVQMDPYQHILKIFIANLKHYLRGQECMKDILKMYQKAFNLAPPSLNEKELLMLTFNWLYNNSTTHYKAYLQNLSNYIETEMYFTIL